MAEFEAGARPGPHPEPSPDLASQPLPLRVLKATTALYRLHPLRYEDQPLYFGQGLENRFAAPAGEFGVLYAGDSPHCAFVGTFGRQLGIRLVREPVLQEYCLTDVHLLAELRLVDLTGARLRSIDADARLPHGSYPVTQRWSLTLWQHPDQPDGLCWHSRLDDDRLSFGIFDRASEKLVPACQGSLMLPKHPALLREILESYEFGLL
ncbi:MAG: RES family NAD+ phosphorylase [Chloroflexi bacterium]|nr:RES family NAD+ phosphorylase [Chloroflexota bacterium]